MTWLRTLVTGTLLGLVGVALFGAIHAWLIAPIWTRLFGGLLFTVPAGIATAWSFAELLRARRPRSPWRFGLLFGAGIWAALVPMTAFAAWLRASGLRSRLGEAEAVVEVAIAGLTAFAAGYAFSRSRRGAIAFAVCLVGLVLAMAGPIPVANNSRSFALFVAFLPVYLIAGLVLALAFRGVDRDAVGTLP